MEIKIVILNWNGRAHLERFLPSVVSHSTGASVVVADNGSDDDSAAFLRKHYPQVELLLLDKNYGYAEGYNRALEQVAADCYVLLNSDVEVEEGWLGPLAELMASDERIAALAPKILSYDRPGYFEYAGATADFSTHSVIRSAGGVSSIRSSRTTDSTILPATCFGPRAPA